MAGATYGNGQVFSQTLTPRQQTLRSRSVKSAELPVDLTYTYTARAQIASINDQTVANIDQTFTYDGIGRLTASTGPWGNGVFQYDGLGNLRQRQVGTRTIMLSYDANNRLSSHTDTAGSPRSLTYDARGNVTALGALGFTYDVSDQPRTVTGTATGSYTYDGHMRRVKQVVGGAVRYSVYDAGGGLVEIDEVSGAKTDYIRASGMTLARIAGAAVTWLHHDHLGSAVAGTNSAGAVIWRESEQPFGEDWTSTAANDNQAGYTGHIEDAATGLTYMQARYYDPVIGRFLSIDPVGFSPVRPDIFNRYAYAGNDPVNMVDSTGEVPMAIVPIIRAIRVARATSSIASGSKTSTLGSPAAQYHYTVISGASCACFAIIDYGDLTASASEGFDDRIFDVVKVKGKGKIEDEVDTDAIGDDLLDEGIELIENSIKIREEDNKGRPKGNPNGDGREKEEYTRYKGHQDRINREKSWLEKLRKRQKELPPVRKKPPHD